jgi:signal transduction histidine kinase
VLPGRTRRIGVLLAAAAIVPVIALSWLGLRILQQDRDLDRQRLRERLEVSAGRVAVDIDRQLLAIEDQLAEGAGIRLLPSGLGAAGDQRILYQPVAHALGHRPATAALTAAEREEFQRGSLDAAAAAYRRLSRSPDPSLRAVSLVALGRVLRRTGEHAGALAAYADLGQLGNVLVAGQPAALVAWQGRCKVFEKAGDLERLRDCAAALGEMLDNGSWNIDRATFDLYRDLLAQWGAPARRTEAVVRTRVAVDLWQAWRAGTLAPRGRRIVHRDGLAMLAVWAGGPERPVLWLAPGAELEAAWRSIWEAEALIVSLTDTDGRAIVGEPRAGGVTLTSAESRLPFMLSAFARDDIDGASAGVGRAALVGGLLMALLLTLGAGYGVYRATSRELLLARQQSEFVAAVSHEFRTPLTSMRHLTEILVARDTISADRRAYYYGLLAQETERLHRLVEGLLSFGRMDAGAYAWQLEPADVRQLLTDTIDEFRREPIARGRQLLSSFEEDLPAVRADRDALARAVWNLLENAGKYSAPGSPIRVFARREADAVVIGVADEGAGIPQAEQESIFQKFVRGAEAQRGRVRGVGMGLTLVKRIVEAHGGSVQLQSEPGHGSTFSLVIPCRGS